MFDIFLNAYRKKEQPLIQLYWLSNIIYKDLVVIETPLAQANIIKTFEGYLIFAHEDHTTFEIPSSLNAAQKNYYGKLARSIQLQYVAAISK